MTIDTFWNERDQISTKSNRLIKDLLDVRGGTNVSLVNVNPFRPANNEMLINRMTDLSFLSRTA